MPTFSDYVDDFNRDQSVRWLEPMSAHEIKLHESPNFDNHIAEEKFDGHRGLLHIGSKSNRAFSRRVSKKTGWFSENTEQIPHIRDLELSHLQGTVLDGEFDYGNTSMGVQSVMGALPETALSFQEEHGFIPFKVFDILYYKGVNIQRMPLHKRKAYLALALSQIESDYILMADMYVESEYFYNIRHKFLAETSLFSEETAKLLGNHIIVTDSFDSLYASILSREGEGIMVKPIDGIYEQKRSKSFLKVKGQSTWDCFVIGFTPPTHYYEGKELKTWKYWEVGGSIALLDGLAEAEAIQLSQGMEVNPVTKPYYMGWCGAIQFGVYRDGEVVHVGDCKGLSEKELEYIKEKGDELINIEAVIEVLANGIIDESKGSLRHPRFLKWRRDKTSDMCQWDAHIRKLG